ncbi:hypothetical protein ACGE24_06255 [Corynebacterium kroppenstedtii]|uniref:hypothetical protein n=1 Tax=Corynebacterium sp. PCR 32 TaxID=3351342 RepID=UPI0030B0FD03
MLVPPDRTTFRHRLASLFQDWRWDGTWVMRVIPTDGSTPLFSNNDAQSSSHRRITENMLTQGFPGSTIHFINLDNHDTTTTPHNPDNPEQFIAHIAQNLASYTTRPLTDIFVYQLGHWRGFALHHMWGDGATIRDRLGNVYAYLGSTWPLGRFANEHQNQPDTRRHTPIPPTLTLTSATFLLHLAGFAESLIRHPKETLTSINDILTSEKTTHDHPPIEPTPAELRTTTMTYTWEGQPEDKPRAIPLAWDWWTELNNHLDQRDGYLDPNQFWLIVGLRHNSTLLTHRGGNLGGRSRITVGGDRHTDIQTTKNRVKSPFAITRTVMSGLPQFIKQMLHLPRTVAPATMTTHAATSPHTITTMWTYNRLTADEPQEISVGIQGLGSLLVGSFEDDNTYHVVISGFVNPTVHKAGTEALNRIITNAGYTRT